MIYLNDAPVPAQHQASVRSIPAVLAKPASFTHLRQADRPDITVPSTDTAPAKQEACQQPPQQPELIVLDDNSDNEMPEQASLGRNKAAVNSWQHVSAPKHSPTAQHSAGSREPSTGSREVVKQESCTHAATDTGQLMATQSPLTPVSLYHQQPQPSILGQTATLPSQGTPTHKRKLEQMQQADNLGAGGKPAQPSQGAPTHKRKLEEMQQADNLGAGGKPARPAAAIALASGLLQPKADSEASAVRASAMASGSLQLKAGGASARPAAASALASGLLQLKADSRAPAVRASAMASGSLQLKADSEASAVRTSVTRPLPLASSTSALKGMPLTIQGSAQTLFVDLADLAVSFSYDANNLIITCVALCSNGCFQVCSHQCQGATDAFCCLCSVCMTVRTGKFFHA